MLSCICIYIDFFFNCLVSFFHHKYIFFRINNSLNIWQYSVCLCCWHIWLYKKIRKWQIFLPFPKKIILYSMIMLPMEVSFLVWIKYPMSNYIHCMVYISNCAHQLHQGTIFTDVIRNVKDSIYLTFIDLITNTLIYFVSFLVKHYSVQKFDPTRINLRLTYQWCFNIP